MLLVIGEDRCYYKYHHHYTTTSVVIGGMTISSYKNGEVGGMRKNTHPLFLYKL